METEIRFGLNPRPVENSITEDGKLNFPGQTIQDSYDHMMGKQKMFFNAFVDSANGMENNKMRVAFVYGVCLGYTSVIRDYRDIGLEVADFERADQMLSRIQGIQVMFDRFGKRTDLPADKGAINVDLIKRRLSRVSPEFTQGIDNMIDLLTDPEERDTLISGVIFGILPFLARDERLREAV